MLQTICPLYKPPGRDTIARRIDDLYTVMASKFREELSKVPFVSITTDIWTETMQMRRFRGITTHLIQDGKLKTRNILYYLYNFTYYFKTTYFIYNYRKYWYCGIVRRPYSNLYWAYFD